MTVDLWQKADTELEKTFYRSPGNVFSNIEILIINYSFNLKLEIFVLLVIVPTIVIQHMQYVVNHMMFSKDLFN